MEPPQRTRGQSLGDLLLTICTRYTTLSLIRTSSHGRAQRQLLFPGCLKSFSSSKAGVWVAAARVEGSAFAPR